jgi:hypothetical protein
VKLLFAVYFALFCLYPLTSQAKNKVDIIVIGTGELFEDAKNNALRTALEQVSGLYLASQTKIVNDIIKKDDIKAITNGTIVKYKILNKDFLNEKYVLTLKATISPHDLLNYVKKSSNTSVTLDGDIYVSNMKQKELDKIAEELALENLVEIYRNEIRKCFKYSIQTEEPITQSTIYNRKEVLLNLKITMKPNKNYSKLRHFILTNLLKLGIPKNKVDEYIRITGNSVFAYPISKKENYLNHPIEIRRANSFDYNRPNTFYLRNWFELPANELINFTINDGNCDWVFNQKPDYYKPISWISNKPLITNIENNRIQKSTSYAIGSFEYGTSLFNLFLYNSQDLITITIKFKYDSEDFQNVRNFTIIE